MELDRMRISFFFRCWYGLLSGVLMTGIQGFIRFTELFYLRSLVFL